VLENQAEKGTLPLGLLVVLAVVIQIVYEVVSSQGVCLPLLERRRRLPFVLFAASLYLCLGIHFIHT